MEKTKFFFRLLIILAVFCLNLVVIGHRAEAYVTCAYDKICEESYSGCRKVTDSRSGFYGKNITGGYSKVTCNCPGGCSFDAYQWYSDPKGCWKNITSTAPTEVSCCTNSDCNTGYQCYNNSCVVSPTCIGWNVTIDSGASNFGLITSAGTNTWEATCTDFDCTSGICYYKAGYSINFLPPKSFNPYSFGNDRVYYNTSGSTKTRTCNFTVYNSATPGLKAYCSGITNVKSGQEAPDPSSPSCAGWDKTVDSGGTAIGTVTANNADTWSASCTDFSCSNFICNYTSGYTQNYSGTIDKSGLLNSNTIIANTQYYNSSGSTKKRVCEFKVWKQSDTSKIGTCYGNTTVNSGIPMPDDTETSCTGFANYLNSGDTVIRAVSATNADTWSASCTDFECISAVCNYKSPGFTQEFPPRSFKPGESTIVGNAQYFNTSGSTQTRTCDYKVWKSSDPTNVKTCTGTDTVCSEGYIWNGYTCQCNDQNCGINDPVPTLSLYADPYSLSNPGESTNVYWVASNATSCTPSGGTGNWLDWKSPSGGQETYALQGTTTFYMECFNDYGSSGLKWVTVNVGGGSFSCLNTSGLDLSNTFPCPDDSLGLTFDTTITIPTASCSIPAGSNPKCEYACISGFTFNPLTKKCESTSPTCGGDAPPINSEVCDTNTGPGNWHYTDTCSSADPCEFKCKNSYTYNSSNGTCARTEIPGEPKTGLTFCQIPSDRSQLCEDGQAVNVRMEQVNGVPMWKWTCQGINGGISKDGSAVRDCSWTEVN